MVKSGDRAYDAYTGDFLGIVDFVYEDGVEGWAVMTNGNHYCCGHINTRG